MFPAIRARRGFLGGRWNEDPVKLPFTLRSRLPGTSSRYSIQYDLPIQRFAFSIATLLLVATAAFYLPARREIGRAHV